jgi:hypothetical protein
MTELPVTGVYGAGMDQFVRDEAELGIRVAACLDDEQIDPLGFVADHHFREDVKAEVAASLDDYAQREAG